MVMQKHKRGPSGKNNKNSRYQVSFDKAHKIKVPNHPTEFCSQPWFPLVLRVNNPTGFVDKAALYNAVVSQLSGISFAASALNVRFQSIRVWGPIPTTATPLVLRVFDVFDEVLSSGAADQMILEEITDYADQVNRARVGYVFSTAQQQKSILLVAGSNDKFVALGGAGNTSVMYIHLLWRPYPTAIPNLSQQDSDWDDGIEVVRTNSPHPSRVSRLRI